jgi:hypothetical protein
MTAQEEFTELARTLKSIMNKGEGFALLMKLDGEYNYASNADRSDVRKTLTEWLARAEAGVNTRDPGETPARASTRTKFEAKCADLGFLLEVERHRVVFFLFHFGDPGQDLAWWTNAPNVIEVVKHFLEATEGT